MKPGKRENVEQLCINDEQYAASLLQNIGFQLQRLQTVQDSSHFYCFEDSKKVHNLVLVKQLQLINTRLTQLTATVADLQEHVASLGRLINTVPGIAKPGTSASTAAALSGSECTASQQWENLQDCWRNHQEQLFTAAHALSQTTYTTDPAEASQIAAVVKQLQALGDKLSSQKQPV